MALNRTPYENLCHQSGQLHPHVIDAVAKTMHKANNHELTKVCYWCACVERPISIASAERSLDEGRRAANWAEQWLN